MSKHAIEDRNKPLRTDRLKSSQLIHHSYGDLVLLIGNPVKQSAAINQPPKRKENAAFWIENLCANNLQSSRQLKAVFSCRQASTDDVLTSVFWISISTYKVCIQTPSA